MGIEALVSIVAAPLALLNEIAGPIVTVILDAFTTVIGELITLLATAVDCFGNCICEILINRTFPGVLSQPTVCIDDNDGTEKGENVLQAAVPMLLSIAEAAQAVL